MGIAILLAGLVLWIFTDLVKISDQTILLGTAPIALNVYDVEILTLLVGVIAGLTGRFLRHESSDEAH
jgi:uncharacterized membrane protein AbrB (regulator of aidB expression)